MAIDLASMLYMRQQQNADLKRLQQEQRQQAVAQHLSEAARFAEEQRNNAFERQAKTAESLGNLAAQLGEKEPEMETPAMREQARVGQMRARAELLDSQRKFGQKFGLQQLSQWGDMAKAEFQEGSRDKRHQSGLDMQWDIANLRAKTARRGQDLRSTLQKRDASNLMVKNTLRSLEAYSRSQYLPDSKRREATNLMLQVAELQRSGVAPEEIEAELMKLDLPSRFGQRGAVPTSSAPVAGADDPEAELDSWYE